MRATFTTRGYEKLVQFVMFRRSCDVTGHAPPSFTRANGRRRYRVCESVHVPSPFEHATHYL